MADDNASPTAVADGEDESFAKSAATEERGSFAGGAGSQSMRGASGVLREAIQKVMEEIDHHEREAKKHSQQAKDLRSELRDSFSYLLEQGEKKKQAAATEARAAIPGASEEVKPPPAGKRLKGEGKKQPPGRKKK